MREEIHVKVINWYKEGNFMVSNGKLRILHVFGIMDMGGQKL